MANSWVSQPYPPRGARYNGNQLSDLRKHKQNIPDNINLTPFRWLRAAHKDTYVHPQRLRQMFAYWGQHTCQIVDYS